MGHGSGEMKAGLITESQDGVSPRPRYVWLLCIPFSGQRFRSAISLSRSTGPGADRSLRYRTASRAVVPRRDAVTTRFRAASAARVSREALSEVIVPKLQATAMAIDRAYAGEIGGSTTQLASRGVASR